MALKVLTVDDSKTIRMIVKKAFKPYDCELFEGENGVEGLTLAAREKPDLIVLDITMPVMNGIEVLEKLKAEPGLKDIPVIMLTAESGKDNVMQIVKMGVSDYMVKPFKGAQLIERAAKIVTLEPKKESEPKNKALVTSRYVSTDGSIQSIALPAKPGKEILAEVTGYLKSGIKPAAESGINMLIVNLSKQSGINISIIKLIISAAEKCQESNVRFRLVGSSELSSELKGFQETSALTVYQTVEEAKGA